MEKKTKKTIKTSRAYTTPRVDTKKEYLGIWHLVRKEGNTMTLKNVDTQEIITITKARLSLFETGQTALLTQRCREWLEKHK